MKWATKDEVGGQQPPAFWLIRRFIDPEAEFFFFPKESAAAQAADIGALSLYCRGATFSKDKVSRNTFDAVIDHYALRGKDPALDQMAEMFNDMSFRVRQGLPLRQPAAAGLRAVTSGYKEIEPDLHARVEQLIRIYDAVYRSFVTANAEAALAQAAAAATPEAPAA